MSDFQKQYEVGKGKPPKATRFKPGQSGNPKGRPKGRKNFATELAEVLNAPVSITEQGKTRKVSSRMATLMRLRKKALEGDGRAMDRFLDLAIEHSREEDAAQAEKGLSQREEDILERFVGDQMASRSSDAMQETCNE